MPCGQQLEREITGQSRFGFQLAGNELGHAGQCISLAVQRLWFPVPGAVLPACVLGLFLLQSSTVRQQHCTQGPGRGRAVDATTEPRPDQTRQVAGMIQVRVSEDHRINTCWWHRMNRSVAMRHCARPALCRDRVLYAPAK
jgi:hypothetical protein